MAGVARVAIVGSIGGLALARVLGRVVLDVHVYEKAMSFASAAGAGFILQPNGAACLQGIWRIVVTLLGADGRVMGRSSAFGEMHTRFAQPLGGVLRSELVDMLARPLAEQQRLHYSCTVEAVRQSSDGVTATLSTGENIRADILIGADGVHSIIAGAIDAVREELRRESPWPASLRHQSALGSNPTEREHVFYGVILDPERPFAHPKLGLPHNLLEDLRHGEFISYGLGRGRNQSAEGGGPCRALMWMQTGLNMAIEDAVVLIECLAGPFAHVEEAFEAYTRRRHARTTTCILQAEANAALLRSRSATLDWWRDSLLGAALSGGVLQRTLAAQIEGGPVPLGPAAADERK
ncbi:hypothetical protein T492DRAFT_1121906 [Pavlovales sp. CCMP2436]|nr:hypothetical protein T492DRAFT_1121906 [Pavlovales sp. CCMP2436]